MIGNKLTTADKVRTWLNDNERSISWLARQMEISRNTLHERLNNNSWKLYEVLALKHLGILKD